MSAERIAVVGAGLIGSSLAAALQRAGNKHTFACVDRSAATRRKALASGLFDEAATRYSRIRRPVDLVFIAVPVLSFGAVLADVAPHLDGQTVVFDCGSTKHPAVLAARRILGGQARRFVPCHPIAGREHPGIDAADPGLFAGRSVILAPAESSAAAVRKVRRIWRLAGARINVMDAVEHDMVFAAVSHLPHALAFALVDMIGGEPLSKDMFENAASGFRDFTRIASSSPEMWRDILLANKSNVLGAIASYERGLSGIKRAIRSGDGDELMRRFEQARKLRNRWLKQIEQ